MPIRISIADEQSGLKIDRVRIREVVRKTLQSQQVRDAEISVALIDDSAMHVLNRRHLDHDYPTDVLSFLLSDEHSGNDASEESPLEGEIIISTETAMRQAGEYGWTPQAELTLYLVHGLLHLCGYDDHSSADRRKMRAVERVVLQIWGLTPHYAG
ncbi:MAG: rRNA maturation RNase YbeY [Planctomycetaceae bacterium]